MDLKQQNTNQYGISQQLLVLSELVNYGTVSIPYGNSARYDCILDIQGDIYKIQIKSLNILQDGKTVVVPMHNSRMAADGTVRKIYTKNQVDYIAFIYNYQVYLIPTGLANSSFTLSLVPPTKSNQHFIEDYIINKVLNIDLKTWTQLKEETRKLKQDKVKVYYCPDCGAEVTEEGNRCITCARMFSRKTERPSREILKEKIRKESFSEIGRQYGVTDNAIRKWCRTYNLPDKVRDIKQISDEDWRLI